MTEQGIRRGQQGLREEQQQGGDEDAVPEEVGEVREVREVREGI